MSNAIKTNPFIEIPEVILQPGEYMAPLNIYTNKGYVINPVYFVTNYGRYFSIATGKLEEKQLIINPSGYFEVQVMTSAGQKHILAHRGVLATFCPRPDMYDLGVDHIYGNHYDNRLSCLRWVTIAENNQAAHNNNIIPPRERTISDDNIIKLMKLALEGYSDEEISQILSKEVKISSETIRIIRTGQNIYGDIIKRLGFEPIKKHEHVTLTQEDYDKIDQLFRAGNSTNEIAEAVGCATKTVRNLIKKWYGDRYQRADLNNLQRQEQQESSYRRANPIIEAPNLPSGVEFKPINIYTSNLHIINPYYGATTEGKIYSMAKGNSWTEMTPRLNEKGYETIGLNTNHGSKQFFVHRIILATFRPRNDMYDLDVDHINGKHNDNRLSNLDWVDHLENVRRAVDTGLTKHHNPQKAPDEDIIRINDLAWSGKSDEEITDLMNNKYTLSNITIIRSGLKSYREDYKRLGISPCLKRRPSFTEEDKQEIVRLIKEGVKLGRSLMELYQEVAESYGSSMGAIRTIYGKLRGNSK